MRCCSDKRFMFVLMLLCAVAWCGCGPRHAAEVVETERVFTYPSRQLPPPPVYNRLDIALLPAPLPTRSVSPRVEKRILPVMQFEVDEVTLEEAALILASSSRYESYTASEVADKRLSLRMLGTIEEIAHRIGSSLGIHAAVDHQQRQIQFLARQKVAPRLFSNEVEAHEYQSDN